MQTLQERLSELFARAYAALGLSVDEHGTSKVFPSDRPELADFQCNDALKFSKLRGVSPRELAEEIIAAIPENAVIKDLEIAGPGFINITVHPAFLAAHIRELEAGPTFGAAPLGNRKVLVDYGGFNIAKPLHVGHLRSSIVGDSIRRLHLFLGNRTTGDVHLGDWGTQMGMVIEGIKREMPNLPYFDESFAGPYPEASPVSVDDLERIYPAMSALSKEDPSVLEAAKQATLELQNGRPGYRALWQAFVDVSIAAAKRDMDLLGVTFDWWYGESHYHDRIAPMIDRLKAAGKAVESEGALIVPLETPAGQKELPPLLLAKSDGAYLYSTTDLASIDERVAADGFDEIYYEVDQRQSLHFEQVFAAAKQTGIARPETKLKFLGHGTINGPDGRPFKSRAGGVMKLHDLIQLSLEKARERMDETGIAKDYPESEREDIVRKVGIAALKYADLKNARTSDYNFDTEQFILFEGRTGPYLLYTAVRIKSILRKVGVPVDASKLQPAGDAEKDLMLRLTFLPSVIATMHDAGTPHVLADHLFKLAQAFNTFYQKCNILKEEDADLQASWLALVAITLKQLELGLDLLGIEVPERM